jgi:MerR family transcriptional regulator, copper efflux regulator
MKEVAVQLLTIGRLAKLAGVGVETIRFYEREGLLARPDRRPSGYRQYRPDVVRRVRFIRHAKDLGFTLREIQELLELRVDPASTCEDVRKRARGKVADIEERIASLEQMKAALLRLARRCRGNGPTSECPILEELDREEEGRNADG